MLLATYDFVNGGLHFALSDPLGTKRVQVSGTGMAELDCSSLPFGNWFNNLRSTTCAPPGNGSGNDATENHFTGKERDTESGLDYFGARYLASATGRWLTPDPSGLAYANMANPQTLNFYSYVHDSPLNFIDPLGLTPVEQNFPVGGDSGITFFLHPNTDKDADSIAPCEKRAGAFCMHIDVHCNVPGSRLCSTAFAIPIVMPGTPRTPGDLPSYSFTPNKLTPTHIRLLIPGTNYCGPGNRGGTPADRVDAACQAHDQCFKNAGVSAFNYVFTNTPKQAAAMQSCNAALATTINAITWPTSNEQGEATIVSTIFNLQSGYSLRPFW